MLNTQISIKKTIAISCLALLTCYTGWLLYETNRTTFVPPTDATHPDFIIKNVVYVDTNDLGHIKTRFMSPQVIHYPKQDTYYFLSPHVIAYSEDGKAPWDITALYGQSTDHNETLVLWKNVRLHELASAKNADTLITTSKLFIYPKLNYAHTDAPVTLIQPDLTVNSIGMNVYFKEKRVQLLKQAHEVYDETKKTQ